MARSRNPQWSDLARLQDRLNRLIEQALAGVGEGLEGGVGSGWRPAIDLVETGDAFLVYVEVPGVWRDDVKLEAGERWLEISGHREPQPADSTFLRLEGSYGAFRRRLELPSEVDGDGITARLDQGLLEVRVPKRQASRRTRVDIRES